jgi:rhamnulokinase
MAVIAPASHDTASAVAAVPTAGGDWAYCSSGTWSLMGVETPRPYITDETLARNYTNEGGVFGTTRLLKNICGMWLLEECRREWARQGIETGYDELLESAQASEPFRSVIDVDDASFVAPGGMPQRIAEYCRATNQPAPETPGQFARAIFESLALKYRMVIDDLAAITGRRAKTLHVVGGGSQNILLCQYTADACGIPVIAGPVEATAMGNILLQAMAMGRLAGAAEIREVVRRSAELTTYEPAASRDAWAEAAAKLEKLLKAAP